MENTVHTSHPEVLNRLKRAYGHLRAVIAMIEERRPCTETAQQLHAVVRALDGAKRTYIQDHIDHCITAESHDTASETIRDLQAIVKYL